MDEDFEQSWVKLPLWKNAFDELIAAGVAYGQVVKAEWFEERLKVTRDNMSYGLAVSAVRRELEKLGFYLCGRGQNGNQFIIVPPESNQNVILSNNRVAIDKMKRSVILGSNTKLDSLTEDQRRRHEAILEKTSIRLALLQRTAQVVRIIRPRRPEILKLKAS